MYHETRLIPKTHHGYRPVQRGFTLIELLIVVAIIAILAAIAVPNFLEAQTRAKVSRSVADMRTTATAIESYAVDNNSYPLMGILIQNGAVEIPQLTGSAAAAHKFLYQSVTTPVAYITTIHTDPFVNPGTVTASWAPYYPRYFYTNFDWFSAITQPSPPAVIAQKKVTYGTWVLAGAGPDGDRLDLSRDIQYDSTNGTVSDGDIIRGPRVTGK